MRRIAALAALYLTLPSAASAHLGHFGALAGHDHWVAGAAIGAAVAVAAWGVLAGKKARTSEEKAGQDADAEAETEGA
jgi:hypothetical protein